MGGEVTALFAVIPGRVPLGREPGIHLVSERLDDGFRVRRCVTPRNDGGENGLAYLSRPSSRL